MAYRCGRERKEEMAEREREKSQSRIGHTHRTLSAQRNKWERVQTRTREVLFFLLKFIQRWCWLYTKLLAIAPDSSCIYLYIYIFAIIQQWPKRVVSRWRQLGLFYFYYFHFISCILRVYSFSSLWSCLHSISVTIYIQTKRAISFIFQGDPHHSFCTSDANGVE